MKKVLGIMFLVMAFVGAQVSVFAQEEKKEVKTEKTEKVGEKMEKKGEKVEKKAEKMEKKEEAK